VLVQLAVWLVVRPDLAGPQWAEGQELEWWLGLEAVAALLIGLIATDRTSIVRAVLVGWSLQIAHFVVLGEHHDDTLWGVGVFVMAFLAAWATGLALLVHRFLRRDRPSGGT
jgi:hypothetical protein